jgi:ribonuclease HI
MSASATMHIDGAARGNPGPAAYAVVIARDGGPVVEEAETIGTATNNVAEYTALVRGLELAADLGIKKLAIFSDSELLVKQMNGEYRVKNADLLVLYEEANRLKNSFTSVTITHVRREQNKRADALGNEALDGKRGKQSGEHREQREDDTPVAHVPGSPNLSPATVRADALDVLRTAAQAWASRGLGAVPVEAVWDQLWSILEDGGVLKKKKK